MSKYVIRKRKIKSTKSRDEKVSLELAFEPKLFIVGVRRKSSGSEFQTAGPVTQHVTPISVTTLLLLCYHHVIIIIIIKLLQISTNSRFLFLVLQIHQSYVLSSSILFLPYFFVMLRFPRTWSRYIEFYGPEWSAEKKCSSNRWWTFRWSAAVLPWCELCHQVGTSYDPKHSTQHDWSACARFIMHRSDPLTHQILTVFLLLVNKINVSINGQK